MDYMENKVRLYVTFALMSSFWVNNTEYIHFIDINVLVFV